MNVMVAWRKKNNIACIRENYPEIAPLGFFVYLWLWWFSKPELSDVIIIHTYALRFKWSMGDTQNNQFRQYYSRRIRFSSRNTFVSLFMLGMSGCVVHKVYAMQHANITFPILRRVKHPNNHFQCLLFICLEFNKCIFTFDEQRKF